MLGAVLAAAEMTSGHAAGAAGSPISAPTPIRHVVVVYQENHSFDNVLGQLCAQHLRPTPCDGATTGQVSSGSTIKLTKSPDIVPNVDNSRGAQTTAINGGKMNRFSRIGGCSSGSHYACYSQYWPSQIPNLSNLATAFAVSDRTFELNPVPTWGGHVELVAATLDGFTGDNPPPKSSSGVGWGCDSTMDAYWRSSPSKAAVLVPACVPKPDKSGPYRTSPVSWVPTIMDRLDAAAHSWKLYANRSGQSGYTLSVCPTFADCIFTSQAANMTSPPTILDDAAAGALPNFSVLLPPGPSGGTSQHNGYSMAEGDNWIGQVVSAIENGPNWSSTAIFITYDDCGCFYDHVAPPAGLGIRVPMVIVSPFAKKGYTDSTSASFASMLAFTEHVFGLAPLGTADANAYDYAGSFDFNQKPAAAVRTVQTPISASERSYIASHPPDPSDPT